MKKFFGFNEAEIKVLERLNSPEKIQDFLNRLPINFEEGGDTCYSPRYVLKHKKAHCSEAALLAATAFWYHGQKPLLMDLKATSNDFDHVVCLFKRDGCWGAISKTNHAVLRYREPIYKTLRELALSYFHEYFKHNGEKTLLSFSEPFDLSKLKDKSWMTSEQNQWEMMIMLDDSKHHPLLTPKQRKHLRKADRLEIEAGKLVEWKPKKKKL